MKERSKEMNDNLNEIENSEIANSETKNLNNSVGKKSNGGLTVCKTIMWVLFGIRLVALLAFFYVNFVKNDFMVDYLRSNNDTLSSIAIATYAILSLDVLKTLLFIAVCKTEKVILAVLYTLSFIITSYMSSIDIFFGLGCIACTIIIKKLKRKSSDKINNTTE